MNYLFKLAKRVSRLRAGFLFLLAAAACTPGQKTDFLGPNPGGGAPKLSMIRIEPKVTSARVGTSIKFTATGYSATGSTMPVSIDWLAQGGSISADGEYTGVTAGQFTVVARAREDATLSDSASVGVWNAPIDQVAIIVSPDSALIEEGDSLDFTAAVALANGTVAGDAVVAWSADGGSITPAGRFTVGVSGVYTVSAAAVSGLRGYAKVFVRARARAMQRISLNPKTSTVTPGTTTNYTATALYADGTSGTPSLQWSATGGSVTSTGVYTAGTKGGSYRVIAQNSQATVADTAAVTISAPSVVGIAIAPKTVTLAPTATATFSGLARLSDGSFTAIPVTYTATGGTISSSGTYVAGAAVGSYRAIVTAPGVPGADTATISVVQPVATLTGILLNPATVSLGAGQTRQFSITGVWSDGSSSAPPVSWTAAGGSITPSGLYTAGSAPGSYRVIASTAGGKADTSQVTVLPAILTTLTVSPAAGNVLAGQTLQFGATGTWSDGSATAPAVTWNATGGTITAAGLYSAGTSSGTYRVIATQQSGGTLADTSLVTIAQPAPVLSSIVLSPTSVALAQNGIQQFTGVGLWSDGSTSSPAITWTATGGTVNTTGRYTAGTTAGTFRVIARLTSGTMADTSSIVITAPAIVTSLTIAPKSTTSQVGSVTQFLTSAMWSNGSTTVPPLTWTATGGAVNGSGLYTAAGTPGSFQVIVAHTGGTRKDTANVTLTAAPPPPAATLTSLVISPKPTSVLTGQTRQFSVSGGWSDGSTTLPSVTWTATGGSITTGGLYSAGPTAGTYRVIAQHQGGTLADTSTVTVTPSAAVLNSVSIAPKPASGAINTTIQFTASALWSDGGTTVPALTWTATGGTVNAAGLYTAGATTGSFRVIAAGGGKADTSAITLAATAPPPPPPGTATLSSLTIAPKTISLAPGENQFFLVTAQWSDGSTTLPALTWSATGGTINNGIYTSASSGTYRVIASGGGKADTATVTVGSGVAPTLTTLNVSPKPVTVSTGSNVQFNASATWSDGSTTPPAVVWTATGGTINGSGLYTAGGSTGSFRVIATSGTKADTSAVTLQVPAPPTLTNLSISPKSAAFVILGVQQFTATALWSNGTTTLPALSWSATGGIITGSGLYTAAGLTGSYRAIVSGGGKADTATITLSLLPPPPPPPGSKDMFFNSAESGCGTDSNLMMCDDFEDGTWYAKNCDDANNSGGLLQTKGWCGTIYSNPILPTAAAVCGNKGFRSNCAASSGFHAGSIGGQNMADHGFTQTGLNEAYWRLYFQPQLDYTGGHEKMFDFTRGVGTGQMLALCYNYFGNQTIACMPYLHQDDGVQGQANGWMVNNVGAQVTLQRGHWYFIEMHIRLNTPGVYDGLFEYWLNDCGTDGSGCTGTPTLRGRYPAVKFRNTGAEATAAIGGVWIENWANAATIGTMFYDQIKAAKVGPIGYMP